MAPTTETDRPPAWEILERALTQRRTVEARYHGHRRLLCPHALGWKNGRAKALIYQADGTTTTGPLPTNARQRWRSLFIDEIEDPTITDDQWQTASNYSPESSGIDALVVHVGSPPESLARPVTAIPETAKVHPYVPRENR